MRHPCYSCSGRDCASCISPALLVRSALARHDLPSRRRRLLPPRLPPAMLMLPHVTMPHCFASQVGLNRHSASLALDFYPRAGPQLALAAASRLCRRLGLRQAAAVSRRVSFIAMTLHPAGAQFPPYFAPPLVCCSHLVARMHFRVPLARGRRRPLPLRLAAAMGVHCMCFSCVVSRVLQPRRALSRA